jgi:hypothetical protein
MKNSPLPLTPSPEGEGTGGEVLKIITKNF